MHLSYAPKFHVLYEHTPGILHMMNGSFDMGEDMIERWHQIRVRHQERIRRLRSENMQKNNAAKCEHAANDKLMTNAIDEVCANAKRNFKRKPEESKKVINQERKKGRRLATRIDMKQEIEAEDRTIAPTNRERLKIEHIETQDA